MVTDVFEAARELGTTLGRRHEREVRNRMICSSTCLVAEFRPSPSYPLLCLSVTQEEMARMRGVEKEHMLYDPTRFKSTAVRQAALEAGGGCSAAADTANLDAAAAAHTHKRVPDCTHEEYGQYAVQQRARAQDRRCGWR